MDKPIVNLPPGLEHLSADRHVEQNRGNDLGQEAFLELMVTQLKNQNPLQPMESGDFLSQIAQFGTVNGITELQQSFSMLASSLQSSQALQASTMVGRDVVVARDFVQHKPETPTMIGVELAVPASDVRVMIQDELGQVVRQMGAGAQPDGIVDFQWDGLDAQGNAMPAGRFNIKAEAVIDGVNQNVPTLIRASVESVTLPRDGNPPVLNLTDIGAVQMNAIKRVL